MYKMNFWPKDNILVYYSRYSSALIHIKTEVSSVPFNAKSLPKISTWVISVGGRGFHYAFIALLLSLKLQQTVQFIPNQQARLTVNLLTSDRRGLSQVK